MNTKPTFGAKFFALVGVGVLTLILALTSWFTTTEGHIYYVQNKLTGGTEVYAEPGIHLKVPGFTNVSTYKGVVTIDMTSAEAANFTRNLNPVDVQYADTYTGAVPMTFRFRLPTDPEVFRQLHKDYRGYANLVDSLLVNTSINAAVVTATQYTGEEFFQGGVNAYKARMEDQLRNGLYVTKREQVTIKDTGYAAVSSTNADANKVEVTERLVTKNVIQRDADGNPRRQENPLAAYGIQVTQVTIGRPIADSGLESLLQQKRASVGRKITAQQNIETNIVEAEAAKQEREIAKQVAIQDAQREKELAVIAGQQKVEVERQAALRELVQQNKQKDVAVVQKEKELAIAEANRDIQKAAAQAAEFEGQAILAKGLAEAEVDQAKLQAKQSARDIYMAEIQRDIAKVMYPALEGVVIDMPDFYAPGNGGADGDAINSLEVFTNLGALDMIEKRSAKPSTE